MNHDPERTMAGLLREIARQVARLSPDWTMPERFYERRSDLVHELRKLARTVGRTAQAGRKERT